ncbi:hypothetical protein TSAR_003901, partial [Trichomalopsis sarcophagae]
AALGRSRPQRLFPTHTGSSDSRIRDSAEAAAGNQLENSGRAGCITRATQDRLRLSAERKTASREVVSDKVEANCPHISGTEPEVEDHL